MVTDTTIKKGYKQTELGVIPEDWEVLKLGELNAEKFPALNPQMFKDELFEYYSIPDYQEYKRPSFVLGKTIQSSKVLFKDKTILFGRLNPRVEKVWLVESLSKKRKIGSGEWITVLPDNVNHISKYIYYLEWSKYVMPIAKENVSGTTPSRQRIISSFFYKIKVPIPSDSKEQTAIATVLSDTDALIERLEKLIAKKKAIKQGTMQQLLTGKKRLPGFSREWETNAFGSMVEINKGQQLNKSELAVSGEYPDWNGGIEPSGYTNKWNMFENTITISEGGNSCGFVNYCKTKFWLGGHCYSLKITNTDLDKEFLYQFLKFKEKSIMSMRIGSGLPNIQKKNLNEFELFIPKDKSEQTAIAMTLSDMDAEIESLEQKRDKYTILKQGMMQQLLTGRIRIYANN